jgi:predicted alpha/beta superfamily hydrolase
LWVQALVALTILSSAEGFDRAFVIKVVRTALTGHSNSSVVLARELPAAAGWELLEPATVAVAEEVGIARLDRYSFHSVALPEPASRSVLVYLPPQYGEEPERRFPVFYLHDGQNLIDPLTSYIAGHTWRAHTTADRLALAGEIEPVILVGVANTGLRRMAEYTPTRDYKMGGGEGQVYGRLLIDELKPLVDAGYRTLAGPQNTAVGGSSLGGLISLFLALERPDVFGKAAVLSPSLWWNQRSILELVRRAEPTPRPKIWLDIGTSEGAHHVRDAAMLHRLLLRRGWRNGVDLKYFLAENAVHTEDAWAARFDRVLRFLFGASGV